MKSKFSNIKIPIFCYLIFEIAFISFELWALSFDISFSYSPLARRLYFLISA